jgi:hypothetical protein
MGPTIIARGLAHELTGAADNFIEVLDDQIVNLPCTQERLGYCVQLVSDVNRSVALLQPLNFAISPIEGLALFLISQKSNPKIAIASTHKPSFHIIIMLQLGTW